MKKVIFLGLILGSLSLSCAKESDSIIEGVWRMVYATGETAGENYPEQIIGFQMKIWIDGYFSYIGQFSHPEALLLCRILAGVHISWMASIVRNS